MASMQKLSLLSKPVDSDVIYSNKETCSKLKQYLSKSNMPFGAKSTLSGQQFSNFKQKESKMMGSASSQGSLLKAKPFRAQDSVNFGSTSKRDFTTNNNTYYQWIQPQLEKE
jgi:hypothetical protein